MNPRKWNQIFELARSEPPPDPPPGFAARVTRALEREARPVAVSLLEEFGGLLPRFAVGAALVIVLCVAVDFGAGALGEPDLAAGVSQASEPWLFATKGF